MKMLWHRNLTLTSGSQMLRRMPKVETSSTWLLRPGHILQQRSLHIPPFLLPPVIFTGLLVTLWCWKCTMLVLLQNTIIYNPYLPPNARKLKISDYARQCRGIKWRQESLQSLDGTGIALCVSQIDSVATKPTAKPFDGAKTPVYIMYFQGNASSLPPRLPDISSVLRRVQLEDDAFHCTLIGISYRGYWTSHDRPSEKGINKDTEAALRWMSDEHYRTSQGSKQPKPVVILWGQSVGCGFATNLAASASPSFSNSTNLPIDALVLETPFTNSRDMLTALYPQKWLPYKHLWPFLWNHLDSHKNIKILGEKYAASQRQRPAIYIVEAGKDELVPADHGTRLQRQCEDVGLPVVRQVVRSALHNDVMVRADGREVVARSILSAVRKVMEIRTKESQ